MGKIYVLRVIHGFFALYFLLCLLYLYYAVFTSTFNILLVIVVARLGIEGTLVFIVNNGDCPLVHIQKSIGDDIPFFQLFLSQKLAK